MKNILFKNSQIIDYSNGKIKKGFDVLVQGNIVTAISDKPIDSSESMVINLEGRTLMPGLIDAHVHVMAADIDLANEHIPETEVTLQAAKFLEDMLMRGFTSVRDAGGADMGLASAINKGLIKSPRLFYCGKAISQTGGHGDFRKPNIGKDICACACSGSNISTIADGVDEVRKAARNEIRKGAHQIKIMASGGVASPTDRITNLQYSGEEIRAIVEEAHHAGIYVMAHAYSAEAIIHCIENGVRTIEHGNLLNEDAAKLMAKNNAYLVPTLVIYEALANLGPKLGFPAESLNKISGVRSSGLEAIKIARSNGVKIGFGTDLLGIEGQTWESKEFTIRSAVESPFETIKSATEVNAQILNQHGKLGVIAEGAFADLIVVDGNPLEQINLLAHQGENLSLIMKDGVIYKNTI